MADAMVIEDPNAVINALTAHIKELERSNKLLANELGRYVELPRETKELLNIMRMQGVIPLYLGSKNYDALKQDFANRGPAALEAFEKIWFLDNAPVSQEVKDILRKAANHGMNRW